MALPETAPPVELEVQHSEEDDIICWRDPEEISTNDRMKYRLTPHSNISCSDEGLRTNAINEIERLGGVICSNISGYDKSCTHLVCAKLNRGEKVLCSISAGKWVLGMDYVIDSAAAGHFLDVS